MSPFYKSGKKDYAALIVAPLSKLNEINQGFGLGTTQLLSAHWIGLVVFDHPFSFYYFFFESKSHPENTTSGRGFFS
jgi:hypothetical protein